MKSVIAYRLGIGAAIGLLCLWLALRNVPFADLGRSMADARYIWLLPAIVVQLLSIVARAQRWVVLLHREERLVDSFWSQGVGYLFTNIFPLRLGEPARVIVMSERCQLPAMQVAASAMVERLLDVTTILLALLLVLPWMAVPAFVTQAGMSFGILILLAFPTLLLVVRFSRHGDRFLQSIRHRVAFLADGRILARGGELVNGLAPLTHRPTALRAIGWSIATWALSILAYWFILRVIEPESAVIEAAFMIIALSLAVAVPSSPGFVGVFQLVGQQALVLPFGAKYDTVEALAITLTAHVTYYLLTSSLGVIGLLILGKSFISLGRLIVRRPSAREIIVKAESTR